MDNKKAKIRISNYIGPAIKLKSGVPQGSILSPTLFILYTSDMPEPSAGCYSIVFADDHTQIVTQPGRSRQMLARKTQREIQKLNDYETKWKIQTNKNKFQLVSVSSTKPANIAIGNQQLPFNRSVTIG